MMTTAVGRFVVCLHAEETGDLQVRKLYEVRADAAASDRGYVRIIDDSGEDYLYPAAWFAPVEISRVVERALAGPTATNAPRQKSTRTLPRSAQERRR